MYSVMHECSKYSGKVLNLGMASGFLFDQSSQRQTVSNLQKAPELGKHGGGLQGASGYF